jgi:hypothetical protein
MESKSGSENGCYRSLFRHVDCTDECYIEVGEFQDDSSDQEISEDAALAPS